MRIAVFSWQSYTMQVEIVDDLPIYDKIFGTTRMPYQVGRSCVIYTVVGLRGFRVCV